MIRVLDRKTGERRVLTRGAADPDLGAHLRGPEADAYVDTLSTAADGDLEIVTRSVRLRSGLSAPKASDSAFTHDLEDERELLARNAGGAHPRLESGLREHLRERGIDLARSVPSAEPPIPVVVSLKGIPRLDLPKAPDPTQGGLLWSALDVAAARERAIIDRKNAVHALQQGVKGLIAGLGGRVVYASWMSGLVQAELPPAAILPLAGHPDVFSIEYVSPAVQLGGMDGEDIFVATNSEDFYVNHSGFHGDTNKHPQTSRVAIAMGEQCIDQTAPQWLTGQPGSASRVTFYDCDPGGAGGSCSLGGLEVCWNEATGNPTHGHFVAGSMVGDFMDGQDPGVATNAMRRRRSAPCSECRLYYMQDYHLNQRPKVEDMACELGVDIFESSLGWYLDASCDGHGFLEDSVEALADCDVVYVVSAGNTGDSGCDIPKLQPGAPEADCTVAHPADHPWTFAVGGMQTDGACLTAGDYYTSNCAYDGCASRGGASYNGVAGRAKIVDITAPFRISHGLIPGTSNPVSIGTVVGTSFSALIAASLMGQMMDWTKTHLRTWLLYGTGSGTSRSCSATVRQQERTTQYTATFDKRWGAGRIGLVPFDDFPLDRVSLFDLTLAKNQSYTFNHAVNSGAVFYKAVVWHDGTDYSNEPDIELTLNPSGCPTSTASRLVSDSKLLLTTPLSNCTGMAVTIKNVGNGSSGTRRFLFASYSAPIANERQF